jgi:DNA-directed RNA polymerase specialized sigma24 family protein
MLTTSDMRQLLENNLAALCELLRAPSGFVAAVVGPDLVLEAVVGPDEARQQITQVGDWSESLGQILRSRNLHQPMAHADFWLWPLIDEEDTAEGVRVLGLLGLHARAATPWLAPEEDQVVTAMRGRMAEALADRKLQQTIFAALRTLIPTMERAQQLRNVVPYSSSDSAQEQMESLLNPSPIHSPEFEAWVKDALSHYWGGPKLTRSPLIRLRLVGETLAHADDDPTKALRLVLGQAIDRLRPDGKQNLTAPEWLLYNILEMRFIKGRKVREIADQLAISESDLYRKQRVAIGHLAQVLSEMEIENGIEGVQRGDGPVEEPVGQGQTG